MEIHSTLLLLKDLLQTHDVEKDHDFLLDSLNGALFADGFEINKIEHTFIRKLFELQTPDSNGFLESLILVFVCLICAGLASGLTQGLLSLDIMEMTIKSRSGTPAERINAAKVIPIISNHHLLLVTLMLWNASATEALPVFLGRMVPEWLAIVISVTAVLFVGEIIPASILTGPNQLVIASKLTPLVYFVLAIFYPIAYPISKALDWFLGHDSHMTMYNRSEISTMMALQHEEGVKRQIEMGPTHGLDAVHEEEVVIIGGALKFREMTVEEVMTPLSAAYMIPATEKLSYKTLYEIFKSGYSRIPVYDTDVNDIIGLILAKDLIFVDAEDETPVLNFIELFGRKAAMVWRDDKLGQTLSMFQQTRGHMAIVRDVVSVGEADPVYRVVGIITLEDIIEEILGTEIIDETDNMAESDLFQGTTFKDMDFIRLKLLHNKMKDDVLSPDEVKAIVAHLSVNCSQIQHLYSNNLPALTELIRKSAVLNMKRRSLKDNCPVVEDMLYRRGKMSSMCTLILNGKIGVLAGKDEFFSEKGPWSTLGADALTSVEGTYIPDFSAFIASETLRFVSITLPNTQYNQEVSSPYSNSSDSGLRVKSPHNINIFGSGANSGVGGGVLSDRRRGATPRRYSNAPLYQSPSPRSNTPRSIRSPLSRSHHNLSTGNLSPLPLPHSLLQNTHGSRHDTVGAAIEAHNDRIDSATGLYGHGIADSGSASSSHSAFPFGNNTTSNTTSNNRGSGGQSRNNSATSFENTPREYNVVQGYKGSPSDRNEENLQLLKNMTGQAQSITPQQPHHHLNTLHTLPSTHQTQLQMTRLSPIKSSTSGELNEEEEEKMSGEKQSLLSVQNINNSQNITSFGPFSTDNSPEVFTNNSQNITTKNTLSNTNLNIETDYESQPLIPKTDFSPLSSKNNSFGFMSTKSPISSKSPNSLTKYAIFPNYESVSALQKVDSTRGDGITEFSTGNEKSLK